MSGYFGYTRVSTVKQGDGVSLEAQRDAIVGYAEKHNLAILEWFEEKETAAKRGRPVFNQVVSALRNGEAAGLIIHKIDRSARNFSDWAMVGELIDSGIDVRFAHESLDLQSRGGRLTADIQAVIAADYVRNLREETIKGIEGRLKQGLFPFGAPIGYLDQGPGKPKVQDPERAPFVRQAFELYATQQYSLRALVDELRKRGFRNRQGKPITKCSLENLLRNRFYCGTIYLKRTGRIYQGVHKPIISKTLFDRVQTIKGDRHHKKRVIHGHTYRRLLTCGYCLKSLYGEVQKGRVYMRCQTKRCPTTTIRQDRLEAMISNSLQTLQIPKSEQDRLNAAMCRWLGQRNKADDRKAIQLQLHNLEQRENQLTDALIDGLIDRAAFQSRKDKLQDDKACLEEALVNLGDFAADERLAMRFLELVKSLYLTYQLGNATQKRCIAEIVFSNRSLTGKNLYLAPRNWCVEVEDTMRVLCGGPDRTTSRIKEQVQEALDAIGL